MPIRRSPEDAYAWFELNLLNAAGVLPPTFEGGRIGPATRVYDLNGEELFLRFPVRKERSGVGHADVGTNPALGAVLVAAAGGEWNERAILNEARAAIAKQTRRKPAALRFVAYSFPKLAVQVGRGKGDEAELYELFTWRPVPRRSDRREDEPPSDFERWSFLEEQAPAQRKRNTSRFQKETAGLDAILERLKRRPDDLISRLVVERVFPFSISDLFIETSELHYSTRSGDHFTCYELRNQQTSVWCVAASVQMLLDFYRYEYTQVRLAAELGLGTVANPNGLPYARDGDVVTVIEKMTSNALDANMTVSPNWSEFRTEIRANRPLVSFIPGHSRTVAGYTRIGLTGFGLVPFRGLLVYDPAPPGIGAITRWENFDAQSYRRTFTAHVTLV
jgi:Peptidase_C39 like family